MGGAAVVGAFALPKVSAPPQTVRMSTLGGSVVADDFSRLAGQLMANAIAYRSDAQLLAAYKRGQQRPWPVSYTTTGNVSTATIVVRGALLKEHRYMVRRAYLTDGITFDRPQQL